MLTRRLWVGLSRRVVSFYCSQIELYSLSTSSVNRSSFVLVIEANSDHQLLIGYSLRASVVSTEPVFIATTEETIRYLDECSSGQNPFPQLILLDIHLPQPEQGWQLLKYLKTHYRYLPVLVLSSDSGSDYVNQAYELGANSFIAKPIRLESWEGHFRILLPYWLDVVTLPPAL